MNVDNIQIVLDHYLPDELNHLECDLEAPLPKTTDAAIDFIEVIDRTDHIAYNLLLLKREIELS